MKPVLVGDTQQLPIGSLDLDLDNPRLRRLGQEAIDDADELETELEVAFEPLQVAESIAAHGFFVNEALIGIPSPTSTGRFLIVEGNRRLVALRGLSMPTVRAGFQDPEAWEKLAQKRAFTPDTLIPVAVYDERKTVDAIIGFRHISGILEWRPSAQASFIADRVKLDGRSFDEVAEMCGIKRVDVMLRYRDYQIALQARDAGVEVADLESGFSLLTVAMNTSNLREYVGAPPSSQVTTSAPPIPEAKTAELKELMSWLFGDSTRELTEVVTDSRQIGRLGQVVGDDKALAVLKKTRSLDQALDAIKGKGLDPKDALERNLTTATRAVGAATDLAADYSGDAKIQKSVGDLREAVDGLEAVFSAP